MENIDEEENFDDALISTETLHDIRDGNQTHPKIDKREARLAIHDRINQNNLYVFYFVRVLYGKLRRTLR